MQLYYRIRWLKCALRRIRAKRQLVPMDFTWAEPILDTMEVGYAWRSILFALYPLLRIIEVIHNNWLSNWFFNFGYPLERAIACGTCSTMKR